MYLSYTFLAVKIVLKGLQEAPGFRVYDDDDDDDDEKETCLKTQCLTFTYPSMYESHVVNLSIMIQLFRCFIRR